MDTQYNLNNIGTMVVISLELEVEVFRRQERKSPFLVLLAGYTAKHREIMHRVGIELTPVTVFSRSSKRFYLVTYCIKWVKTS